ncbi:hypothetical protein PoB_000285000 [Plakobranchus ocellatus]|uniref:Uncharacterized protein n=1 Tax=Plakobranchus ocellatus TaxID=259542 RepID=A0AAV3Y0W4_9GAST|nr:hypothetical protein PoB_000285000 [Plakobranchus ocellatus]
MFNILYVLVSHNKYGINLSHIYKGRSQDRWTRHPSFSAHDHYDALNREESTTILRLRTGRTSSESTCTPSSTLERQPAASVNKGPNQRNTSYRLAQT